MGGGIPQARGGGGQPLVVDGDVLGEVGGGQ